MLCGHNCNPHYVQWQRKWVLYVVLTTNGDAIHNNGTNCRSISRRHGNDMHYNRGTFWRRHIAVFVEWVQPIAWQLDNKRGLSAGNKHSKYDIRRTHLV